MDFGELLAALNPKEFEVAELSILGFSGKEIAERMGLSPGRVSQLRRQVWEKWQAQQRGELNRGEED